MTGLDTPATGSTIITGTRRNYKFNHTLKYKLMHHYYIKLSLTITWHIIYKHTFLPPRIGLIVALPFLMKICFRICSGDNIRCEM